VTAVVSPRSRVSGKRKPPVSPSGREYVKAKIVPKLRRHDQTIPIIAASWGTKRAVVDAIFQLGLFAYIPKPVDYVSSST
jgi:hypothetical protein